LLDGPDGMAAFEEPETGRAAGSLRPVAHRNYWIAAGLLIQLAGAATPIAVLCDGRAADGS
jgi:hypothetical protein